MVSATTKDRVNTMWIALLSLKYHQQCSQGTRFELGAEHFMRLKHARDALEANLPSAPPEKN